MPGHGKSFEARRGGVRCADCNQLILLGQNVRYKYDGDRVLCHVDCGAVKAETEKLATEAPYKISGGSGYGCQGWQVGQVLRNDKRDKRYVDYPAYMTVMRNSARYFREDGLSFGVGDDQGYIYSADCRAATADEIAQVIEQAHATALRGDAVKQLESIQESICRAENYVNDGSQPEGERLMDTTNIYGGGHWWVIGISGIWYIEKNGMDGDDWSRNNVAGSIGWRVAYSDELADRIRQLAHQIKS